MVYNLSQHFTPTRWIHEWDRSALCCARASRSILSHRVNQAAVCAFSSFLSCELFVFLNLWLSLSTRLLIFGHRVFDRTGWRAAKAEATSEVGWSGRKIANIFCGKVFLLSRNFIHTEKTSRFIAHNVTRFKSLNLNDYGTSWKYVMMGKTGSFFFAVVPKTLPAASARCFDMHHCLGSSLANSRKNCQQFMIPPATTSEVITSLTALRVYSRKCTSRKKPSKSIKHGSFFLMVFYHSRLQRNTADSLFTL